MQDRARLEIILADELASWRYRASSNPADPLHAKIETGEEIGRLLFGLGFAGRRPMTGVDVILACEGSG